VTARSRYEQWTLTRPSTKQLGRDWFGISFRFIFTDNLRKLQTQGLVTLRDILDAPVEVWLELKIPLVVYSENTRVPSVRC
jgi:hypothetical protein